MATLIYTIIALSISIWVAKTFGTGLFGVVCFGAFLPGYKLVIAIDLIFWGYRDHHKRNDERAKKVMESQRVITKEQTRDLLKERELRKQEREAFEAEVLERYRREKRFEKEILLEKL